MAQSNGFVRPPEAPVFRPTPEEFASPLLYILKIRPEAERAGICKVIPPAGWKPPFSINASTFRFRTRLQRLCELEGASRMRTNFRERLAAFWENQGVTDFREPVLERRTLDLFRLHKEVAQRGGYAAVTENKLWTDITRALGFSKQAGARVSTTAYFLRNHYERLLIPFETYLTGLRGDAKEGAGHEALSMRSMKRASVDEKAPSAAPAMRSVKPSLAPAVAKADVDGMPGGVDAGAEDSARASTEEDQCRVCGRNDNEPMLLLCDGCDAAYHMFCLTPPLSKVPPGDWHCPDCLRVRVADHNDSFGFEDAGLHSLDSFRRVSERFEAEHFKGERRTPQELEREFWGLVSGADPEVAVQYGADIHTSKTGSGFPTKATATAETQTYVGHGWNLNNIPVLAESVLGHIRADISGMMVPWLYVGMCFSSFCWHYEDHWSHSINYLHWGSPKTWYGVPGASSEAFERAMRESFPELFESNPGLLFQLTTLISPAALMAKGVPVVRTDQREGEFVITFPRAYHAGFNNGYNCAEAVNFATYDWLPLGQRCVEMYREVARSPVFSHDELLANVCVSNDVDIAIAMQARVELSRRLEWERARRKCLVEGGLTSIIAREIEVLNDDERECVTCRMSCYWSGVQCGCAPKRMACLDHAGDLCACPVGKKVLAVRHSLSDMEELLAKLEVYASKLSRFDADAMSLVTKAERPAIRSVKSMLNAARRLMASLGTLSDGDGAPLFSLSCIAPLEQALALSEEARAAGNALQVRMQRTRSGKEDLPSVDEVVAWIATAQAAPCDLSDLVSRMEKVRAHAIAFRTRAREFLASAPEFGGDTTEASSFVDLAEALDVRVEEAQAVRECHERWQWHETCVRATQDPQSFTLAELRELVTKGRSCGYKCAEGDAVRTLHDRAVAWVGRARPVLQTRTDAETLSQVLREGEALRLHMDEVDELRDALKKERDWNDKVAAMMTAVASIDAFEAHLCRARALPCVPAKESEVNAAIAEVRDWVTRADALFFRRGRREDESPVPLADALRLVDPATVMRRRERQAAQAAADRHCCGEQISGMMVNCDLCQGWFHTRCVGARRDAVSQRDRFFCPDCAKTRRPTLDKLVRLMDESQKLRATSREVDAVRRQYEAALSFSNRARAMLAAWGTEKELSPDDEAHLRRLLMEGDALEIVVPEIAQLLALLPREDAASERDESDVSEPSANGARLHCVCRQPSRGFMIACDLCDEWFHGKCVGVDEREAESMASFKCAACIRAPPVSVEGPLSPESEGRARANTKAHNAEPARSVRAHATPPHTPSHPSADDAPRRHVSPKRAAETDPVVPAKRPREDVPPYRPSLLPPRAVPVPPPLPQSLLPQEQYYHAPPMYAYGAAPHMARGYVPNVPMPALPAQRWYPPGPFGSYYYY